MYSEQITQRIGLPAPIHPQSISGQTVATGGVDMSVFHRALFVLDLGAVTASPSVNATLQEANQSNFADASNLAGNNVSQTGITAASKQVTFEARADQMTKRYLRLQVTETAGGGNSVLVCVTAWGDEAGHKPGSLQNGNQMLTQNVVS
jgi:hypothetical protein